MYENIAMRAYGFESSTRKKRAAGQPEKPPKISENLLRVSVFYDSLNEKTITTSAVYTGSNIFSSLGGVLSLFLGISFAMLFEVIEILLDFLNNFFNWMAGRPLGRIYHKF